jgi:predicted DNA-binding transcriptional regulator YafY
VSRPTARVLALLERLQTGGTHPVGALAAELGVDDRTVRRYVDHLLDLDVPVESVRGRYGGYRVAPGYRLPPLMFTDDEAVAVVLALLAVDRESSALHKLRRVLPTRLRHRLTALEATAELTGRPPADHGPEVTRTLLDLAEAAHDRRPVQIDYARRDGQRTRRTLHPYGIVAHHGHWYVTGEDSASHAVRTFRLDRITAALPRAGSFERPALDPTDQVLASLATTPWRHEVTLRVRTTQEHARSTFPRGMAIIGDDEHEGWVRVDLRAEHLDWIPPRLAALDRPFVIERPGELRAEVASLADRLKQAAGGAE